MSYKSRNRVRLENKANRLAAKGERKSVKGQKKIQKGAIKEGKAQRLDKAGKELGGAMGFMARKAAGAADRRADTLKMKGREKMERGERASDRAGKVEKKLVKKAKRKSEKGKKAY